MAWYEYLLGRSWGERVVITLTLVVYAYLFVTRPSDALESLRGGVNTLVRLFTLILAALLLASALGAVIPEETIVRYLGESDGPATIVAAGLVGGLLLGGPYATYPIIESLDEQGASYPAVVSMYIGYGLISIGRVPYGLVIFSPFVVGLRLGFAVLVTLVAALGIHYATSLGRVGIRPKTDG